MECRVESSKLTSYHHGTTSRMPLAEAVVERPERKLYTFWADVPGSGAYSASSKRVGKLKTDFSTCMIFTEAVFHPRLGRRVLRASDEFCAARPKQVWLPSQSGRPIAHCASIIAQYGRDYCDGNSSDWSSLGVDRSTFRFSSTSRSLAQVSGAWSMNVTETLLPQKMTPHDQNLIHWPRARHAGDTHNVALGALQLLLSYPTNPSDNDADDG